MSEIRDDLREALARATFERGRKQGGIDPETWEVAGDEMQAWLLGHADAMIAGPFAPILAQVSALQAEVERLRDDRHKLSVALTSLTPGGSEFFTRRGEDFIADADACVAVVQERRRSHQDAMMRAMRTATEAQERLQKVEGERNAALNAAAILLPFVDMAAGEGLEWSEQECGSPRMDAAELCVQAAEVLGFELGDDQYTALLKQGEDAIRIASEASHAR